MRRLAVNPEPVRQNPQPETPTSEVVAFPDNKSSETTIDPEPANQSFSVTQPTPDGTLKQSQLGKRLGKDQSNVSRNRKKGRSHFREWSKKLDPDGIPWDSADELPALFFKVKELQ